MALTILLIDSDEERSRAQEEGLADFARNIRTTGVDMTTHVEAIQPDLIIIDMSLPDRDALEDIRTVAAAYPVVMFAGTDDPEFAREAIAAGVCSYNLSGVAYDQSNVVAIIYDQYVNAERQRIKGLDLSGSYRFNLGGGRLTARGSISWLDSAQTTSAGQPEQTLAGTVFNPARLKGRVGAVWASGDFSASGFVNYTGGVTNRLATVTEKTASFTTVDTSINYDLGERAGALSGLTLGLSVQNLLNRAPPLYTAAMAVFVPYDATNYSAIGRFVSVSVSKHW